MLTWAENPRCLAYKPDGSICGDKATKIDKQRGVSVCAEHGSTPAPGPAPEPKREPRVVAQAPLPVHATLDCGCRLEPGTRAFEVESHSAGVLWRESACRRHAAIGAVALIGR